MDVKINLLQIKHDFYGGAKVDYASKSFQSYNGIASSVGTTLLSLLTHTGPRTVLFQHSNDV